MIIIGLDMSLSGTGFCRLEDNKEPFLKTIKTNPKKFKTQWERYDFIVNECMNDIPSVEQVDLVCLEEYFTGKNKETTRKLTELGTLIRHRLYHAGYKYLTIEPKQLKKFAANNGNADKDLMGKMVKEKWNIEGEDDNQNDASALAKLAEYLLTYQNDMNIKEKEVIDLVKQERIIYNS